MVFQPNVTLTHAVVFSACVSQAARNKIVTDGMHFPSILYLIDEQRKYGPRWTSFRRTTESRSKRKS